MALPVSISLKLRAAERALEALQRLLQDLDGWDVPCPFCHSLMNHRDYCTYHRAHDALIAAIQVGFELGDG